MDSIVQFLTSCGPSHKTKDFLEGLGKTAASRLVSSDADMNTSIAGFVKENSLNREQTKRVVEAANNAAFNLLMEKEAGYVTFDVADADRCGGAEVKTKLARADYIPGEEFITTEKLASALFGTPEEKEKTASVEVNTVALRQEVSHLLDALEDEKTQALTKVAALQAYIAEAVQTGELTIGEVERSLGLSGATPEFVKVACAGTGVCRGAGAPEVSAVPNPEHPLLQKAAECATATKKYMEKKKETLPRVKELLHAAR